MKCFKKTVRVMTMGPHETETLKRTVILAVDDNSINLRLLRSILKPQGYTTVTALNAEEAFDLLEKEKPEIILLDVMMPVMDGFETARRIRQSPDLKSIPIIFLTSLNETKDIVKGFDAGGVDYVTKPFNPLELLARIRTHIELKRAREEIHTLHGLLPICVECKKIRDKKGVWQKIEAYISERSDAEFTHGMCPECIRKLYPPDTHLFLYVNKKT
jgi:PleD family two-component response regulator